MTRANLSRIGLGASRIGSFNNPQSLRDSIGLIRAAMEIGVTTIDTANIYGQGDSESTIGTALAGPLRNDAFIITKGGRHFSAAARALRWAKPLLRPLLGARGGGEAVTARRSDHLRADWRPHALKAGLADSLRRLRTDHVDGFLLHSPPGSLLTHSATAQELDAALAHLRDRGMARYVGVSCDDAASLAAALALPSITLLEIPADLMDRAMRHAEAISARGIIVVAREVIRLRAQRAPAAAIRAAVDQPLVACVLVGTTNREHLRDAVNAVAPRDADVASLDGAEGRAPRVPRPAENAVASAGQTPLASNRIIA